MKLPKGFGLAVGIVAVMAVIAAALQAKATILSAP